MCRHAAECLLNHACVQRLYAEIRRALHAFYVKPRAAAGGGGSDGWVLWEHGGRKRLPADANALPGPVGGQRLLVKPQAAADGKTGELPKACLCLSRCAAVTLCLLPRLTPAEGCGPGMTCTA